MLKMLGETFYTVPVSGLRNFTDLKTTKEILYESNKYRTEEQFNEINVIGLCQGKHHQVSFNVPVP